MALTKVGPKYQVTIPKAARDAAQIRIGDYVEATIRKEGILLRPQVVVDKQVDVKKRLEEADADLKAGRVFGPFASAKETMCVLKSQRHASTLH